MHTDSVSVNYTLSSWMTLRSSCVILNDLGLHILSWDRAHNFFGRSWRSIFFTNIFFRDSNNFLNFLSILKKTIQKNYIFFGSKCSEWLQYQKTLNLLISFEGWKIYIVYTYIYIHFFGYGWKFVFLYKCLFSWF